MPNTQQAAIKRLAVPAAISVVLMIAAISISNFYVSLILGLGGAGLFAFLLFKLFEARRTLAKGTVKPERPKSPPPE
jgi:threonine dehydrogenase-like Zn-dependent dehydrogenase